MKKSLILLMSAVLGLSPAMARQLTPAQALDNAFGHNALHKPQGGQLNLQRTPLLTGSINGLNTYYVFSADDDSEFAIIAADDLAAPVLGYGLGTFDPANVPDGLQFMLDTYSREIDAATKAGAAHYQKPQYAPTGEVAPFGKTMWDQTAPYNAKCPILSGVRSTAGCAATAAAQCVKVFNYPKQGIGERTYQYQYQYGLYDNSFDFGGTTFDWDNMLDTYTTGYTDVQVDAVATLMQACGVASTMRYSPTASSCNVEQVGVGLIEWMGYDIGMQCLYRNYYHSAEWQQIVYDEVAAGRPVLYTGFSALSGHAFMCDGYSKDGYFHINWGWNGVSDGYFLLSALNPSNPTLGGSTNSFDYEQAILIGIQPPVEGSVKRPIMYCSGSLSAILPVYKREEGVDAKFYINEGLTGSSIHSEALYNIDVKLGMKCETTDGETFYITASTPSRDLAWGQGWDQMALATADMPEGMYIMTPAFYTLGQWYDVKSFAYSHSKVYANVTSDYVYLDENEFVGITDITADADTAVSYTTLAGVKVDRPSTSGIYLRTIRRADGTLTTSKVIIKE